MSEILEQGDLFFFYRPRVGVEEVRSLDDVQRFFCVLEPDGRDVFRRVVIGRKRLPQAEAHEREWAFVAEVTQDAMRIRDDLERKTYETKTRGVRVQPEARAVGEGRYAVADHGGHTHLAYALELPHEPGEAQQLFGICRQASYIVAVRNPDAPAPPGAGLSSRQRPDLPPEIRERFGGRRFIALNPPDILDYTGVEIVLIGASKDAERELGIRIETEDESLDTAELFARLRLRPEDVPIDPLVTGRLR
jgi:hypothetical protein